MRLIPSRAAALRWALMGAAIAAPGLALADSAPIRLAQAPAPPSSGWNAPGAAPQAAPGGPATDVRLGAARGVPTGRRLPRLRARQHLLRAAGAAAAVAVVGSAIAAANSCRCARRREKKAAAIKAAAATKKQPVVCAAFKNFAAAEAKVVKYVEDHGTECRIPPEALKAMKANHAKTLEIRTKVCDVAAAPAPRAPSLSDALGTSRVPIAPVENTTGKKSGSTFDTLTGNSLNR